MKNVLFSLYARKARRALAADVRQRIDDKIADLAAGRSVDRTALKGGGFRIRAGDWRVVYDETATTIEIIDIGHRSRIYR